MKDDIVWMLLRCLPVFVPGALLKLQSREGDLTACGKDPLPKIVAEHRLAKVVQGNKTKRRECRIYLCHRSSRDLGKSGDESVYHLTSYPYNPKKEKTL